MSTRMQQRRGTTAEWASANPILAAGELGIDTTLGLPKVGDGTSSWSELDVPFARKSGGDVISSQATGIRPLTLKGFAGQTADLLTFMNSQETVVSSVLPDGSMKAPSFVVGSGSYLAENVTGSVGLGAFTTNPGKKGFVVRSAAAQSANAFEIQDSAGTTRFAVNAAGSASRGASYIFNDEAGDGARFVATSATKMALVAKAAASQSANILEVQNSAGVNVVRVEPSGRLWTTSSVTVAGSGTNTAYIEAIGANPGTKMFLARGAAAQTANMFEAQNSAGATIAHLNSSGDFFQRGERLSPLLSNMGSQFGTISADGRTGIICGSHVGVTSASGVLVIDLGRTFTSVSGFVATPGDAVGNPGTCVVVGTSPTSISVRVYNPAGTQINNTNMRINYFGLASVA